MSRGDVVIVEFPYVDGRHGKRRPALVVQNDRENSRLANTVVAMISGNIRHAHEPTQVLVDPDELIGKTSGLHGRSVVKCCNLFTIRNQDILSTIGHLSAEMKTAVNLGLKEALDIA